jgi:hypothetical protein
MFSAASEIKMRITVTGGARLIGSALTQSPIREPSVGNAYAFDNADADHFPNMIPHGPAEAVLPARSGDYSAPLEPRRLTGRALEPANLGGR